MEKIQIAVGLGLSMTKPIIINASFKITILSANICFQMNKSFVKNQMFGGTICSYDELFDPANPYFIDDNLIVRIEGILSCEKEFQQKCINPEIKNPKGLGEYLWNHDDKDFEFHGGKNFIKVHKCVIGAKSSIFDKMIQSGMKESSESKVTIIDFDYETFKSAIKFLYDYQIVVYLNVSNALIILQFSDKYDISELKELIQQYLFKNKSPMNVCQIVNASIISNSVKLQEKCFDYLLECMKSSIFIKDLDMLDKEFSLDLLKASFRQK